MSIGWFLVFVALCALNVALWVADPGHVAWANAFGAVFAGFGAVREMLR